MPLSITLSFRRLGLAAALPLALGACRREAITVYVAPKDEPIEIPAPSTAPATPPAPRAPRPELTWTLPAGWQKTDAGQVSAANFVIKTEAGSATVNITPLANFEGKEAQIVNMWREQVGQPALSDEDAAKALTEVEVAGGKGKLFEITGTREGKPTRTVTAMGHTAGASWFYKLSGDEAVVAAQQPTFIEFLKSVRMTEAPPVAEKAPEAAPQNGNWKLPEGWRALAPGQMQVAKFAVPEQGTAKAEVSVSVFPSNTGGTLANVNRWRRQIGLGETDEAGLAQCTAPLDPALPEALLIDLPNPPKHLLGAIIPRSGRWWFYKLTGDADAVTAAREGFVTLAKQQP